MSFVVDSLASKYKEVHAEVRAAVARADAAALDWTPGEETNSVQVLVVHSLGSEAEVWRTVAKIKTNRDRLAEFVPSSSTTQALLDQLTAADQLLDEVAPPVLEATLQEQLARGDRPLQSGLGWLLMNYGHSREHAGQIALTLQLYAQAKQAR